MLWLRALCAFVVLLLCSLNIHAAPAVSGKTLNVLLTTPESALDPAVASDIATLSINENIFEPMLRYDYLARPVKLKPNTLNSMPEITKIPMVSTTSCTVAMIAPSANCHSNRNQI